MASESAETALKTAENGGKCAPDGVSAAESKLRKR